MRLLLALLLPLAAFAQEQKPSGFALDRLAWLAGSWRMERAGRVTDEQWMAPAGGVMLGMSRTVAKGKVVEHEFLQIRSGPGGELYYVALPARQKEATFKVATQSETEVVFENKEHDFPQVIGYRLNADGSLLAWIEGPRADGTTRRVEYAYRRIAP
ncbi:hypothetical protein ESB00_10440 [Oleiharenicola lentus]|uniref:DUF6265 domain-containing protein n=1 Tax=Oleiharenicola lentus TaxID=2508720 RepID=A0A4Q1CBH7_9BACT|nr:DUF6265 family protein [Oleiharenicola lentus]RXK56266.1 hypothetical protein ESB00_10440 [Oleiharenicola lentus]